MIAVIFRAKKRNPDAAYNRMVSRLRELAFDRYGCLEFVTAEQGDLEIAISYWANEEAVGRWKQDAEHVLAQELGRGKWYESYIVQVSEIKRQYRFDSAGSAE